MLKQAATLGLLALASCTSSAEAPEALGGAASAAPAPTYLGVETRLLDDDLVNFRVALRAQEGREAVTKYAECAAAQYALIRGFGFARHVRTNVDEVGGTWRADAVYTVSPALPRGVKTIDAEVAVADCRSQAIPTV